MNNKELILQKAYEIFGKQNIDEMIAAGNDPPLHTKKTWKKKSFKIKQNQKPIRILQWYKDTKGYKTKYIEFFTPSQIELTEGK